MHRLTKALFDHIKAAVKDDAAKKNVSGTFAVCDRMTGVMMHAFIRTDKPIFSDKDGTYNTVAIAFAKLGMVLTYLKDSGGETNIAGEVPWMGGHISHDAEFAYGFSGPTQEIDIQLMLTAEAAHITYRPLPVVVMPVRRKLPVERQAITHKFDISGHEGYITDAGRLEPHVAELVNQDWQRHAILQRVRDGLGERVGKTRDR